MIIRRYFILSLLVLLLAGCAGNDISDTPDEERLPLRFETTLSNQLPVTRAVDNKIDASDELLCYVRHVINSETSVYTQVQGNLVTIKDNKPTTALYWDDFSNSNSAETDLRTANHGLQSYYGYCYNGGEPSKKLDSETELTGVLGWETNDDQTAEGAMKANDLLWSQSQKAVVYSHAKNDHGTLIVPYTHAMSKFTIIVEAKEGFVAGNLENTIVTLKEISKVGEFTAPAGTVTASGTTDVKMYTDASTKNELTRTYEAVTVPLTQLTVGSTLATITDAGGNNYEIKVTDKMLDSDCWGGGLTSGKTKSGINYQLTVTLNKQKVSVLATLADWTNVYANGKGEIQFTADVVDCGVTGDKFNDDDAFSLWRTTEANNFGDKATTCTYNKGVFKNNPEIYWPDANSSFYFRALAIKNGNTLVAKDDYAVKQGNDLLWGTSGDAAIAPRTGDVPLTFKHAMSNVSVTLETTTGDASVTLAGASVTLANLNTEGTINIADAVITSNKPSDNAFTGVVDSEKHQVSTLMVPQEFSADARLVITLVDKTTYSLNLSSITAIPKWEGGNKYIYTIHLEKEEMKFSATIQPWVEKTGSGKADLDWD